MSFKTTYILFGILACMLALFCVAVWQQSKPDVSLYVMQEMHDPANPLPDAEVDRVEIDRQKPKPIKIVFARDPGGKHWRITEPRELPADDFSVKNLVRQIYEAQRSGIDEGTPSLKSWGLEPPSEVITLQKGDRKVQLRVGDDTPGQQNAVIYVLASGKDARPAAVDKSSLSSVLQGLNYFRSRDLLVTGHSEIDSFTVSETGKGASSTEPVELKKTSEDSWSYVKPPYGRAQMQALPGGKSSDGIRGLLMDLSNLRVDYRDDKDNDFVADDVGDLARYNLDPDKDRILRIEVQLTPSRSQDEGEKAEAKPIKRALLVGVGKKEGDKYYARLADSRDVVKVDTHNIEPLLSLVKDPDALRDRSLVDLGNLKKPDVLEINNTFGKLEFQRNDTTGKWVLYRDDKPQEVDPLTVQGLISQLTSTRASSFRPDKDRAQLGLDKAEAVVKIWVDGLKSPKDKKDEKKDEKRALKTDVKDKPTVELRFGKEITDRITKAKLVAVERKRADEEQPAILMVPGNVLKNVEQGPLAYLDKALPHFDPETFDPAANVTRLVLKRKDTVIGEVTRTGNEWKIVKPAEIAGRNANLGEVRRILGALNNLKADSLEAEKSDKLGDFGLKEPLYQAIVTVTRNGKPTEYTYDFGKQTDTGVYGKLGWRDMVFVTNKKIVDTLQASLLDLAVFRFDPSKVKSVRLTGWQDTAGEALVLEVEQKGSEWVAKTPPKFKLDSAKVTQLVNELSTLRAKEFLSYKTGPKPAQGLSVDQGALQIDITVSGASKPLRLTVGKPVSDKGGYYATSSTLEGDVFEVDRSLFESAKKGRAYFSP